MEKQSKKWYNTWWFALSMLLLGFAIGVLLRDGNWWGRESGINL